MEEEFKFEVPELTSIRQRLRQSGAEFVSEVNEENWYFDRDGELKQRKEILRLRRDRPVGPAGQERVRLTWKGTTTVDRNVRSRPELEADVGSLDVTAEILKNLGFHETDRLDKRRETWRLGEVEVVLDDLSFGKFVELEGPKTAIRAASARLGLDPAQSLTASYRELRHSQPP